MTCREGRVKAVHHVLNECLLDRGSSPSMVSMECFIDGYHLTNIVVRVLLDDAPTLAHGLEATYVEHICRRTGSSSPRLPALLHTACLQVLPLSTHAVVRQNCHPLDHCFCCRRTYDGAQRAWRAADAHCPPEPVFQAAHRARVVTH